MDIHRAPHFNRKVLFPVGWLSDFEKSGEDHAMKNETAREMVLQTMVALLSMGLAVLSLMLMGRWV